MMALPFVLLSAALVAAAAGRPGLGRALWAATLVALLALFAAHATDPLALDF